MSAVQTSAPILTFKDRALECIKHGLPVIWVRAGEKKTTLLGWENLATTDLDQIEAWNIEPNRNVGCVAKAKLGGFWFLDIDKKETVARIEAETGNKLPATWMSRSQEGRGHLAFKQTAKSIEMGNISEHSTGGAFSARVDNEYIVGPLSYRKDLDRTYELIRDVEPIEAPSWLIEWCNAQKANQARIEPANEPTKALIPHGQIHPYMLKKAGELREKGLLAEEIEAPLLRFVHENCEGPIDDQKVVNMAHSICNFPAGKEDVFLVGGKIAGSPRLPQPEEKIGDWRDRFCTVGQLRQGKIPMLIEGFLPGGVTFFGGLPGEAKTWLALSVAKALTNANEVRLFLGKFHVPAVVPVIYLIPESGDEAFRTRCEKFGIPNDEKLFLCRTITAGKMLLSDIYLLEAVRQLKPLIIMDTLIRFNEAESENEAMQNQKLTDDITALRQAGAVGVLALHHATKALREGEMTQENVLRGTGDLAASADAVWGMRRDSSLWNNGNGPSEIDVVCVKPRDMDPAPLPFRIAITRRALRQIPGISSGVQAGIESVIDATGDVQICKNTTAQDKRDANAVRDAKLIGIITSNPSLTVQAIALEIDEPVSSTGRLLKNLGWHKPNGIWKKKPVLGETDSHAVID